MPEVRYARRALASLRSYDSFLRPRNPSAADAVLSEIERTCDLIAAFPGIGRMDQPSGLRVHITQRYRYRILYQVTPDGIEIRDILHPSRR